MNITNHGAFALYTPVLATRPVEPVAPTPPAPLMPLAPDATPEQQAAFAAAQTAHQAAMASYDTAMQQHQTAMTTWRAAVAVIDHWQALVDVGAIFARRADGGDWYEITKALPDDRHYCLIIDGKVASVAPDAQMFGIQDGMTLLETTDTTAAIGWTWDGTTLAAPPGPTLDEVKTTYKAKIDADAESVRLRYITPGDGMQMTYREKFEQAQGVNSMGEVAANALTQAERQAQFPTLTAGIGIEGPTLWAVAQIVLTKYAQFAQLSFVIEGTRLGAKKSLGEASSEAAVKAIYEAVTWQTP